MEKKKKRNAEKIIIVSAICFVAISVAGYFIFAHFFSQDFRKNPFGDGNILKNDSVRGRNFQPINETTLSEITSFFENSPSSSEVEQYCSSNLMYCMYYCRDMKGSNEICQEILNNSQMPPQGEPPQ